MSKYPLTSEELDAIADRMLERLVKSVEADDLVAQRLAIALINFAGLDYNTWSKPGQRLEEAARAERDTRVVHMPINWSVVVLLVCGIVILMILMKIV